jgi:carbonic anhydrase
MSEVSRRALIAGVGLAAAVSATGAPAFAAETQVTAPAGLTPDQALARLKQGNADFLAGRLPPVAESDAKRRLATARSQKPFAVLVSCSDSRVPPELLFGRGLGELFIIRNAGNTIDTAAMGSLEYAVGVLGVPLVVVMGHERCGAVDAAISVVEKNTLYPGSIGRMVEPIVPAVLSSRGQPGDKLDNAIKANVLRTVERLRTASEPIVLDPLKSGKLKVVGARYDLDDGRVEFFE